MKIWEEKVKETKQEDKDLCQVEEGREEDIEAEEVKIGQAQELSLDVMCQAFSHGTK